MNGCPFAVVSARPGTAFLPALGESTTMACTPTVVTAGVGTHACVHHAAVLDQYGRLLGTQQFPATTRGYQQLLTWLQSHGRLDRVGVEGTGCYGAGLTRTLRAAGVSVV